MGKEGDGNHFLVVKAEGMVVEVVDVVDMEAYALAKYAHRQGINFRCYKYISDNADGEAAADWSAEVRKGAEAFINQVLMSS